MWSVHVAPDGAVVAGREDGTLLELMKAAGLPITHACGGRARCSTCRVRVVDGLEHCNARTEGEAEIAAKLALPPETRLACQTRAAGGLRVRRLVLDEVDLELASTAVSDGAAVGRDEDLVVLFSDVADFTPFSEALPAYDVVHTLDRWFSAAGRVVDQYGGRVDNYMGDGFLAVFPGCDAAVRAGLGLLGVASALSEYTESLYGLPFRTRVGVHRGAVVVGTLGAAHNRRRTVIGDVVNVAARVEAANKELGTALLVTEAVDRSLHPGFHRGRAASLLLKGKSGVHGVVEICAPPSPHIAPSLPPLEAP